MGKYKSWFFMANMNMKLVERSNCLVGYADGLSYSESFIQPSFMMGCSFYNMILWFSAAIMCPVVKWFYLALGVVPKPGEASLTEKTLESGYLNLFAQGDGENGEKVNCILRFYKDVGYKETARMLVESALCFV